MKAISNFLKGMVIGISILVPGISGGTMAIILGIYEDLIHAFSSFTEDWRKHAILLLQVVLGGLLSIKVFSYIMEKVLNTYPQIMHFLFIGIIIGGIPTLFRKYSAIDKKVKGDFTFLILGFFIVLLLSSKSFTLASTFSQQGIYYYLLVFLVGIIIAVALVLPGISGSLILMTLGMYGTTLDAINKLDVFFLTPLIIGILTGILGGSKIIERLIQRYPSKTYMLIIGFVIASIIPIFPGLPTLREILPSLISIVLGILSITTWQVASKNI